jgi:pyruvate kinase
MKVRLSHLPTDAWDARAIAALIDELWVLRKALRAHEIRLSPWLRNVDLAHRPSAINLSHYLAMRRIELRPLQERLAGLGVSSLGRSESHVLANLDKVLGILHRIAGRSWEPLSQEEPTGYMRGGALLAQRAEALFGSAPAERNVRIMVTLPSEAARDVALIDGLVNAGMDVARINCAHDGVREWTAMAEAVRRSARRARRSVRVLMDLGGPKLRTGPVAEGPAVVRLRPSRDVWGRVTASARLGLSPVGSRLAVPGAGLTLGAHREWLRHVQPGDRIELIDARGAQRRLKVVERQPNGVVATCDKTAYLTNETCLSLRRPGSRPHKSRLAGIASQPGRLLLKRGQILNLVADGLGRAAVAATPGRRAARARIACTLPEVLSRMRKGERVWFDDGRIGGVVRRASRRQAEVEITEARDGGEYLGADKGINLPDTRLDLPALTHKDFEDLAVVARHADIVGMSFAQSADDVLALRERLVGLGAAHLGLILKIETRRGFEHLPELLLAAMTAPAAGVMIARGDLAVECGYERMAEVQEEILWACEAAHMPVIWATQVLETLAKTGLPSRAEITDAAMGGRAECVMLNKGPHILDAMRTLTDILRRMQQHQSKKRPLLRALKSWDLTGTRVGGVPAAKRGARTATIGGPPKARSASARRPRSPVVPLGPVLRGRAFRAQGGAPHRSAAPRP